MAAHRRSSHALVSKGRRTEQLHMDVARNVAAHGHFSSLDAVHAGIAAGAAARDSDFETGHETEIHEMLRHRRRQLEFGQNSAFADPQIGQRASLAIAVFLMTAEYEVENHFQFQLYSNSFLPQSND